MEFNQIKSDVKLTVFLMKLASNCSYGYGVNTNRNSRSKLLIKTDQLLQKRTQIFQAKKCGNAVLKLLVPLSYVPSLPLFKIW